MIKVHEVWLVFFLVKKLDLRAFSTSFVSQLVTIIIVGFRKFVIQQGNLIVVKEFERHTITETIFLNSFIYKFSVIMKYTVPRSNIKIFHKSLLSLRKVGHELIIFQYFRGIESSTISSINFSILGSNNRFFDKLYDGSWSESSIYIDTSLKLRNKYNIVLICSFRSITGNILQL